MRRLYAVLAGSAASLLFALGVGVSCAPDSPQTGSQTNWFRTCDAVSECGGLDCICGTCTLACDDATDCDDDDVGSCVSSSETGAELACGVDFALDSICLVRCEDDADCPEDLSCSARVCVPEEVALPKVVLDPSATHQTLMGFGVTLAFTEDEVAAHPESATLFNLLMRDSGFAVIRLRNRWEAGVTDALDSTVAIVTGAEASAGRSAKRIINSSSPPAELKANGEKACDANPDTCTLRQTTPGEFDYDGFAAYWLDSVTAYADAGIELDYVSIQNNPDWLPTGSNVMEACHFLPEEGSQMVTVDGTETSIDYPGYLEAAEAVATSFEGISPAPELLAPDSSKVASATQYESVLGAVSALGTHFYDVDAAAVDVDLLAEVRQLGEDAGVPVIQSEMRADGLETAILIHHAMVDLGAVAYVQNDFAASAFLDPNPLAFVQLSEDTFDVQPPYHAMRHYAFWTAPDWVRVEAASEASQVLATAWTAPEEDAATLVLVNRATDSIRIELDLSSLPDTLSQTEISRTIFDGSEPSTSLGELSSDHLIELPGESIVTVAFSE